ncbi:MAG: membrane protein insertase YidC, partial [Candidatus Cloacimonadota bacterium]|nr:membrane protein insertase YidC [Candidatus Cloacimonadota bacterium]
QVSFLWLPDLSAPDTLINLPFNIPMLGSNLGILPILMALFMFLQQKMMMPDTNPTADMDEKQLASLQSQKMMMYVMPVMMFVFFNNFPSGLVLYWTIFNIFSMGQQYLIKKKF